MNKRKYLRELRKALGRIPEAEKEELIEYYAEIIDESYERGKTTREIFATLESPKQVAHDYFNSNEGRINERRRRPTRDEYFSRGRERDDDDDFDRAPRKSERTERRPQREEPKRRNIVLTILLIPFYIIGFVLALAASIVIISLLAADVIVVFACGVAGVYMLVMSFGLFPNNIMLAVTQIGAAFVVFGVAVLLETTVKPLARGTGAFFRLLFHKDQRGGSVAQTHWLRTFVVGLLMVVVGGAMGGFGFYRLEGDWRKLANVGSFEQREQVVNVADNKIDLVLDNLQLNVLPNLNDDVAKIVYYESSELPMTYTSENGVTSLKNGKWSYDFWEYLKQTWSRGVAFSTVLSCNAKATLYIPLQYSGDLSIKADNGALIIGGYSETHWINSFGDVSLSTDNGMIKVQVLSSRTFRAETDNGYIQLDDVTTAVMNVKSMNGALKLTHVSAFKIEASTQNGAVNFTELDANDATFRVSNGAVNGTMAGRRSDYKITASVGNGSCNLTNTTEGDRSLWVRTANGNITIGFASN